MWVHNIVAAVLAFQITQSVTMVATVSVVQFVPQILLAPLVGPLADRSSRGRLVGYGRVFCIVGSVGLAVRLWITGVADVGIAAVLVTTAVVGIGFAVSGPAMQAMVPDLVEAEEVGRAVALDSLPTMLGRAAGPALGGLLVVVAGPAPALLVAAGGHLVFGLIAILIARGDGPVRPSGDGGGFRDGLAYVRRNPAVTVLLLGVAAVGMGADPVVTLAPAFAQDLGESDALVGYLGSAFGVGAVVGSVLTALVGGQVRRYAPSAGLGVLASGLAAVALAGEAWLMCLCFLVAGLGFTVALAGCTALLHEVVPPGMRGRVMSLWLIAFMGTRPIAAILNGVLADAFGARWAIAVLSAGVAMTAAASLPRVLRRAVRAGSART